MRIHRYGDPGVIQADDVPRPEPGPGDALVKVAATSFNPSDLGVRRGLLPTDLPFTLGGDVAGTAEGERVIGRIVAASADYVSAPAQDLVPAPATIPLAHAAAIPIAGLTAWQAVFEHAKAGPGMRLLINGAGGGVGGFAVQLAKYAGAHVTATASARSAATVRAQGADEIVDHTREPLPQGFDAVLNLVHVEPPAIDELLGLGPVVVSITVPFGIHFVARNDTRQLSELVALIDAGAVTVDIAGVRPLTELADVHRAAEAGRLRGKTVLVP
ncbi:NADP-dependent oxidoreductase [Actinoplanes sp. HUAS TT8]|uniref:NADP-dependent oxidoreductase n=1 Tax=Actinoplanes sp. HUAS TT8 TaxID=3447453 RepID=UPI003F51EFBB